MREILQSKNQSMNSSQLVDLILYDRLILQKKKFDYFKLNYKIDKQLWKSQFSSQDKCKENYLENIIVRIKMLFDSKMTNDQNTYKWNKENKLKKTKRYSFTQYCCIDDNGKSIKEKEKLKEFFNDAFSQYQRQQKKDLQNELNWIEKDELVKDNDIVCYYCGVNEIVLKCLRQNKSSTCKTKRNRGLWFELDRKDSTINENEYRSDNIVFCCYFCNNHKSDVMTAGDMRSYFGKSMYKFLTDKFKDLN